MNARPLLVSSGGTRAGRTDRGLGEFLFFHVISLGAELIYSPGPIRGLPASLEAAA